MTVTLECHVPMMEGPEQNRAAEVRRLRAPAEGLALIVIFEGAKGISFLGI